MRHLSRFFNKFRQKKKQLNTNLTDGTYKEKPLAGEKKRTCVSINAALHKNCLTIRRYESFKGAKSRFLHLEKISLNVSSLSFGIRVNLRHP